MLSLGLPSLALLAAITATPCHRLTFEMNRPASVSGRGLDAGLASGSSTLLLDITSGWERRELVFRATDSDAEVTPEPRFREWRTSGPIPTRWARVERVWPRWARSGTSELGLGEKLLGNRYVSSQVSGVGAEGVSRPLVEVRHSSWNTDRWTLTGDSWLVWRFGLEGRQVTAGEIHLSCRRWYDGLFEVDVSADGMRWSPMGAAFTNDFRASLPMALLPAEAVWIRLRGDGGRKTRALLTSVDFDGRVTGEPAYAEGATRFIAADGSSEPFAAAVPWQYREMGARLAASDSRLGLWTVSSGWKVPRSAPPLPRAHVQGVSLAAARNEAEATQLVLSPTAPIEDVSVAVEGLPTELNATVWRVGYIQIATPTDSLGMTGPMADPLPPQTSGLAVEKGQAQPFWVRIRPSKGVEAGTYRGRLVVSARARREAIRADVPFAVEVFDFDFPDAVTIRSLFNVNLGDVNRYHHARTQEDRERLEDLYLEALAENHLSPFRWTQYTKWNVRWEGDEPVLETAAFDRAMRRVKAKHGFNSFRVSGFNSPLCSNDFGLGKANAHETVPAGLCGYVEGDAEYETRVAKLLRRTQEHFREQGFLEEAIFYCFDEPKPDALPIVQRGYARLRRYAPGFKSVITAPVSEALLGGPHIWCPTPAQLESDLQRVRVAAGDEFWTYLAMGPKAPWVTLFPDHPGVELRLWLWQSWAKGLKGVVIWTTTLWNGAANRLPRGVMQNPYVDAMSYNSRNGVYGNCDGRLLYPPLSTVGGDETHPLVPRPARDALCCFERPVSSIRLEMLRDGIEDYECLVRLRALDPWNPLLEVPQSIFRTLTDFNFDPTPIESRRVEILRELVRLRAGRSCPSASENRTRKERES